MDVNPTELVVYEHALGHFALYLTDGGAESCGLRK